MSHTLSRVLFCPGLLTVAILAGLVSPTYAAETTHKLGIVMVDIPAGSLVMGSCAQDKQASCAKPDPEAYDVEMPQHR